MKHHFVFNPEHDLALANGDRHFIAPKNIREMARDLAPLMEVMDTDGPIVWGWDTALVAHLCKMGVSRTELPTDVALAALRHRSERQTAHHLLNTFLAEHPCNHYIGESILIKDIGEIGPYAAQHEHILLKNSLSSSGKGLRHVKTQPIPPREGGGIDFATPQVLPNREDLGGSVTLWAEALIRRHGYLTAEPYYNKVQDFAMEFRADATGCHFIGYSLFTTDHHGRYIGSHLMSDERIEEQLASYVPREALHELRDWIIAHAAQIVPEEWDVKHFPLFFGIDMMIVNSQFRIHNLKSKIHPCVEINLRMNMGIIAHEIYRRLLVPEAKGMFHLAFFPDTAALLAFQQEQQTLHPATYSGNRLIHGYMPLTPIGESTRHLAFIICKET